MSAGISISMVGKDLREEDFWSVVYGRAISREDCSSVDIRMARKKCDLMRTLAVGRHSNVLGDL